MKNENLNNIPSDADFARASKHMEERSRNLDKVRERVIQHFKKICPLHDFYILDQRDVDFRAYVFFEKENDIKKCKSNGVVEKLIDYVYKELEHFGRGNRGEISIDFEIDSHESVNMKYKGNYFNRLL